MIVIQYLGRSDSITEYLRPMKFEQQFYGLYFKLFGFQDTVYEVRFLKIPEATKSFEISYALDKTSR